MKLLLKGFGKGMKEFGENMTAIVNSFLLSIVYFIGVGVTSLFARIKRKRFLKTEIAKEKETYWQDLNLKKKKFKEYYRQF